jgi:TonB family protein
MLIVSLGTPESLAPSGYGLDEEAIKAVKKWKFKPGAMDGHPVAVQVSIETNFHLFPQ